MKYTILRQGKQVTIHSQGGGAIPIMAIDGICDIVTMPPEYWVDNFGRKYRQASETSFFAEDGERYPTL